METSSPLAALQPRAITPSWGMSNFGRPARAERSTARAFGTRLGACRVEENAFDFESLMESSPTTILVADLSQNFHIDRTPLIQTPRRSLFTSFSFARMGKVSTLEIPSSPPPVEVDGSMDCPPLPHKPAFNPTLIESPSISPTTESPNINLRSSPSPKGVSIIIPKSTVLQEASKRIVLHERKKSCALSRQGAHRGRLSATFKNSGVASHSFTFASRASTVPPLDLDEIFAASPQPTEKKERKLTPTFMPVAPPAFRLKSLATAGVPRNCLDGSPVAPLGKTIGPRPRNKIRRTLSMFEHPEETMSPDIKKQENKTMNSSLNAPGENPYLPYFTIKDDPLRRIDKSVLLDVMDGKYKDKYDEFIVIDCRFEYEYEGGHVAGAININTVDALEEKFFRNPKSGKTLIIFHCEYSAHRAPRMALLFRGRDRQLNQHRYPALSYPDMYVLDGGYSAFFNTFRERCEPQQYVEMNDAHHRRTREREMGRLRRASKLVRSQTYAFGSRNDLDASPSSNLTKRSIVGSSRDGRPILQQRRMASY